MRSAYPIRDAVDESIDPSQNLIADRFDIACVLSDPSLDGISPIGREARYSGFSQHRNDRWRAGNLLHHCVLMALDSQADRQHPFGAVVG